jgi:glycerate dehydrogenase
MTSRHDRPARIVFLDRETLSPETRLRAPGFAHELVVHEGTTPDQVAERIASADVVITNKVPLRRDSIRGAERLRLIAVAATGTDVVDLEACAAAGITVSNIRDYAVHTVPEHTFALILALRRSILAYRDSVARGRWQEADQFCYFDYPVRDLAGSTLGVIGDGSIGQSVAELGKAFGMRTLFSAYKGTTSDVITLHAPLMPSTRGMIGRAEFALMERQPLLINTARGGLVDETALEEALTGGQIAGAGFDVVTREPPPADHPLMRLLRLPNFILTPHTAWASEEAIQSLADQLIDNIEAFWAGAPRNVVTT